MRSHRIRLARFIVYALLSTGFAPTARAVPGEDQGYIQGTIIDSMTAEPVAWAWIKVSRASPGAAKAAEVLDLLSDQEGSFATRRLDPGEYTLEVSHVSYRSMDVITLEVRPGKASMVTVKLRPLLYKQSPVVITAMRGASGGSPLARTIRRENLAETPGSFEDPMRVLARAPGVETQSDFDGRLSFRGGSPEEVGYSLDGVPVPAAYHFGGITSIFNPNSVERISSYASAHPAALGPGTAGYVEVQTGGGAYQGSRRLDVSPITMSFLWSGENEADRFGAFVSLRRTYHDIVLKAIGKEKGITVPNFFDGEFRSYFKLGDNHEITLNLLRSGDRVSMGIDGMDSASSENTVTVTGDLSRLSLGWKARSGEGTLGGGASITYQPYEYDMRIQGSDAESMDWDSKSIILTGNFHVLWSNHLIEVGTLIMEQRLRYGISMARGFWKLWSGPPTEGSLEGDPVTISSAGRRSTSYRAVYVQEKWTPLADRVTVTAGLRAENFAASKEAFLSPRISLQYSFGSGEGHVAWGVYRGHPLDKPGDPSAVAEGVLSLKAEHLVVGGKKKVGALGVISLDLYRRRTENVLSETAPGVFSSIGLGKAYGMDVEWMRRGIKWEISASYSFGRSFRLDPGGPLLRTATKGDDGTYSNSFYRGSREWYPDNFDLGHSVNIGAGIDLGAKTHLSLTWAYRSGRRITPIVDVVHSDGGRAYGIEGMPGGARLRPYHRLDVRMSRRFSTSWGALETYIDIANLYNRANLFQSIYNRDYTQRKEYRTLPIIPTFGLAMEF